MRLRTHLLVACITLASVNAVPSPPRLFEGGVLPQTTLSHHPVWRIFSDRIIEKIWGSEDLGTKSSRWEEPQKHTKSRYDEDLLLRFNITTAEEAASLAAIADSMYLDVWEFNRDWVDIRIAKNTLPHVLKTLPKSLQHSHTALLQEKELAQAIYDTYPSPREAQPSVQPASPHSSSQYSPALRSSSASGPEGNLFFTDYQPLSVIQPWMRLLASLFTTHVRLINIGYSFEGREIPALKLGVHPTNDDTPSPRRTVLITGGVHAREWVSTSTVNYIAYTLITGYGKNRLITQLIEDFDWVFVPTINPDGYVYTWEHDRLWRKNRQKTSVRYCYGMDLDRSYGFKWDGESARGNPCSEAFSGDGPFEGVESLALANWAKNETENNNVQLVGFLDLHSYSQQILYPYSYSCDAAPPSLENLQELAVGLAKAIRLNNGHPYQAAQACEGNVAMTNEKKSQRPVFPLLEAGGGSALDWFYHDLKVHYTYQIKLRDRGSYGFLLPKEHIVPSGREMMDAILYFGKYLSSQFELSQKDVDLNLDDGVEKEVASGGAAAHVSHPEPSFASQRYETQSEDDAGELTDEDQSAYWELKKRRKR